MRTFPNENGIDMFKDGKMSIIVTTNLKREKINEEKLRNLIPDELQYDHSCFDKCTNLENAPNPPQDMAYTAAKGLPGKITLMVDAPILITMNDLKYKEDGIVNGARDYVDSFQFDDDNDGSLKVIWIVFRDETVGKRLKME